MSGLAQHRFRHTPAEPSVDLTAVSKGDLVKAIKGVYEIEGVPEFAVAHGDRYHVRLAARGVEVGRERQVLDLDDEPVEHHLVQLWREL